MHTPVLFEHPLNEKMRTAAHRISDPADGFPSADCQPCRCAPFFRNAGDLLDVPSAARCALTVKELERQQRKLQSWAEVPGVDQERINELRHQLKQSSSTLMAAPRIGQFLREDRLIALVRQRLSILAAAAASIYRPCISGSICHRRIATSRWPAGLPASIRWSSP